MRRLKRASREAHMCPMLLSSKHSLWAWLFLVIAFTRCGASDSGAHEIVYWHYGLMQPYHALCALQSRLTNPSAKVTVILHADSDEAAWKEVTEGTGINIYTPTNWDLLNKFKAIYKHSSINQYQKEMLCIYRHLLLHQYMVDNGVSDIMYLDLDIAVFDNIFMAIPPDSTVSSIGAFAIHWKAKSLSAFAHYIWHFYDRDPREVARHIHLSRIGKAGQPKHDEGLAKSPRLDWWPDELYPRRHISDMWLFNHFVKSTRSLHVLCGMVRDKEYNPECPPALQLLRNAHILPEVVNTSMSYTPAQLVRRIKQALDWRKHPVQGTQLPYLTSTTEDQGVVTEPVPGIHFQGTTKAIIASVLCKDVLAAFSSNKKVQRMCQLNAVQRL